MCTSIVYIVSGLFTCAERIDIPATREITQLTVVWRLTIERTNRMETMNDLRYRRKAIAMTLMTHADLAPL